MAAPDDECLTEQRLRDYSVMGARVAYTAEAAFLEGLKHDQFIDAGEWHQLLSKASEAREARRGRLPGSGGTP
jgi:hypothetical protein